jgi:hypothetical protein
MRMHSHKTAIPNSTGIIVSHIPNIIHVCLQLLTHASVSFLRSFKLDGTQSPDRPSSIPIYVDDEPAETHSYKIR